MLICLCVLFTAVQSGLVTASIDRVVIRQSCSNITCNATLRAYGVSAEVTSISFEATFAGVSIPLATIAPGAMDGDVTFAVLDTPVYIVGATGDDNITSYASATVSYLDNNVICV